jgi:rod shape-determining protein MreB and related proteins
MDFGHFGSRSRNIAMDLGTANTLVYVSGEGIVVDEPSVVAIETANGEQRVRAVGTDAKILVGKTPDNIQTFRPLTDGVINDLEIAEEMIKHFICKAGGGSHSLMFRGPEIVICIPTSATTVERRAIRAAALNAGGREVWLIDEPLAAAIGAGLPVKEPIGSMVVDIGGGTTEVGIISLGRLNYGTSARVGGDKMDEAIAAFVRRRHNVIIGEGTAERIKIEIGSALATSEGTHILGCVRGQDVTRGVPCELSLSQADIVEALCEPLSHIVEVVCASLEQAQPEIASDMIDRGITLTGGGALLRNIERVLADETGLPVQVAETPLRCVAIGAGRVLEDQNLRETLCVA